MRPFCKVFDGKEMKFYHRKLLKNITFNIQRLKLFWQKKERIFFKVGYIDRSILQIENRKLVNIKADNHLSTCSHVPKSYPVKSNIPHSIFWMHNECELRIDIKIWTKKCFVLCVAKNVTKLQSAKKNALIPALQKFTLKFSF